MIGHAGPGLDGSDLAADFNDFARDFMPRYARKRGNAPRGSDHADYSQANAAGANPDERIVGPIFGTGMSFGFRGAPNCSNIIARMG
jgi:hypothetical protein